MTGFNPYVAYKDSGVEWLGEVPAHWSVRPLKYSASCNDSVLSESTDDDYEIQYIEISDVDEIAGITASTQHNFSEAPSRARRMLKDGDVLVSTVRTYLRAIAPVVAPENNLIASTGFAVIRPRKPVMHGRYLGYLVRAEWWISGVIAQSVGVSYPAINASDLIALPVTLPLLTEQIQIARFLDHETARIDALIEEQQRLIELLKEKRQAVISHAVTKGLDPIVPMKDSGVEWLGEVPAHWDTGGLRWHATIQGGIAIGKDYKGLETVNVPYLRVANVQTGFVDLTEVKEIQVLGSEIPRYSLRSGDVLMNEGGDSDKLGRGTVWNGQINPCLHQNHVFAIRPNRLLTAEWLAIFTQSEQARRYFFTRSKQSTNLASISATNVMSLTLPLPSIHEQQEIIDYLQMHEAGHDDLVSSAAEAIALLQERRAALISAAVTGKIDVRGWQPPGGSTHTSTQAQEECLEAV